MAVMGLNRAIDSAVSDVGVTIAQYRALALIEQGVSSPSLLAKFLAVTNPTVTTVLNGLVESGLVQRERSVDDRRRVDYALTDEGRKALRVAHEAATERLARLAEALEPGDVEAAFVGLNLWRGALDTITERITARAAGSR